MPGCHGCSVWALYGAWLLSTHSTRAATRSVLTEALAGLWSTQTDRQRIGRTNYEGYPTLTTDPNPNPNPSRNPDPSPTPHQVHPKTPIEDQDEMSSLLQAR